MPNILRESANRDFGFIITEEIYRSRDEGKVAVAADTSIPAGTVLGQLTANFKYVPYDKNGSNGSQVIVGVLIVGIDAEEEARDVNSAILVREAEVKDNRLVWPEGYSASEIQDGIDDLNALGLIVREGDV